MSDPENVGGVYRRDYIMNEDQRSQARSHIHYLLTGETFMPYEEWMANFPVNHFSSLIDNGIKPLLNTYDYYIPTSTQELKQRISYWAWETLVHHQTSRRRRVESNLYSGIHKSRSQYENYTYHITTTDWNELFDNWENEVLFNTVTLEGTEQRNGLPDFLWKFIRDDAYSGSEADSSEEEEPARNVKVKISDLGWISNNRRVF